MNRDDGSEAARILVRERAGVTIAPDPGLIEARLSAIARREGASSVWTLVGAAAKSPRAPLTAEIAAALAPGQTWFFRDREVFTTIAETVLPQVMRSAGAERRPRIWCAGCATGQEAYSIALLVDEARARDGGPEADILGTDLSEAAMRHAQDGLYGHFDIQRGLSVRRLIDNFDKEGESWRARSALRRMVKFQKQNLLRDFSALGAFDIVLLRHVLSGMTAQARASVLRRAAAAVRPGGWLILGEGETALEESDTLVPLNGVSGVFRALPEAGAAAARREGERAAARAARPLAIRTGRSARR